MEYEVAKHLINNAKTEGDLFEARAAIRKYSVISGDAKGVCALYQTLQNKSRKLVNSKPLNQRLYTTIS